VRHKKRASSVTACESGKTRGVAEKQQLEPGNLGRSKGRERQLSFHPEKEAAMSAAL